MPSMPGVKRLTLKRLEVLDIAALLDKFCALQELRLHRIAAIIDRRPPAAATLQQLQQVEMSSCHLHSIPQVRCLLPASSHRMHQSLNTRPAAATEIPTGSHQPDIVEGTGADGNPAGRA